MKNVILIIVVTLTKLLLNTTRRLIYPFAPEFARGMGIELSSVTSIIALNQTTAVFGPVAASFGDRFGYKPLMLFSLVMITIGLFAAGMLPVYPVVLICFFLAGLAKNIFDPTLLAFIGQNVPYKNRGKIIGITEFAWAGSTLIGIPLAGMVISRFSWHTPFFILGGLGVISFLVLLKVLPKHQPSSSGAPGISQILSGWKKIIRSRQVAGILSFSFFMSLANDNLFVIYGAWLEDSFHLSLAAIGFGTIVIGTSEIAGEFFTALFADRIGLKKTVIIGLLLCGTSYFLLPVFNTSLPLVLTGLFIVFFTFEFTIVTAMSLTTELVPESRAATLSAFFAIAGIGRVAGAFLGGILWSHAGLFAISLFSGVCTLVALLSILAGFHRSGQF